MKKLLAILLVCAMAFALVAACAQDAPAPVADPTPAADEPTPTPDAPPPPEEPAELPEVPDVPEGLDLSGLRVALVTHGPPGVSEVFDGSFNEGAWNGIVQFLEDHGLDTTIGDGQLAFFQAHESEDDARVAAMGMAIEWGAQVIVLPGFHFISSSYMAATQFPDTMFIAIDFAPSNPDDPDAPTPPNVVSIIYAEEQPGFLAGYAVVMEGMRELGFMGGAAVPAVIRFGHGFVQGAEHAARELGLSPGEVTVLYNYLGAFGPDPRVATMAGSWFAGGTEVIFVAGGRAWVSVFPEAEHAGAWAVGVDVDQVADSPAVITSAMKALALTVHDMITAFVADEFPGGTNFLFDASVDRVGLPMGTSRFSNFTQAQYDSVFADLVSGAVVVNNDISIAVTDLPLDIVDVIMIVD
ncbi:MAG: BMP family ABC transporter substrate-binding protein [Oscillospiraceae bacterium]|nr:BMP family ABC transporter substrate-binding protein [Oscillospiraceae bacterium]